MTQENQKLPENSYICIRVFMVNDLKLSGNELMFYGLFYVFNKVNAEQKKQTSQRYKQLKAQRTKEENEYKENAVKNTNLSCPKCGKTFPDPSITYSPTDNALYCSCCNASWQAYSPSNVTTKQAS